MDLSSSSTASLTDMMREDEDRRPCSGSMCPMQYDKIQPYNRTGTHACMYFTPKYTPQEIADFLRNIATRIDQSANMT